MMDFRNNTAAQGSRGLRNNNPLNIRPVPSNPYVGQVGIASNGYGVFRSVEYGLRAAVLELYVNYVKHGFKTLAQQINDWAPSSDGNDTQMYIDRVSKLTGINPNAVFAFDTDTLIKIMKAMAIVELGAKYAAMIPGSSYVEGVRLANKTAINVAAKSGGGLVIGGLIVAYFLFRKKRLR